MLFLDSLSPDCTFTTKCQSKSPQYLARDRRLILSEGLAVPRAPGRSPDAAAPQDVEASQIGDQSIPKVSLPEHGIEPDTAFALVRDELAPV